MINLYIGDLPWSRFSMQGRIEDGDWDLNASPFEGWDLFKAMKHRFQDNGDWTETDFYMRVVGEIQKGHVKWGCTTVESFNQRLQRLEDLYHGIKENGYKLQEEIEPEEDPFSWEPDSPFRRYDEVVVCIDRKGRILLRDGKHRLSIAKILGIEKIPVRVGLRHKDWMDFKSEIFEWAMSRGGQSYQPLLHPDLANIPAQHDDGRFELMKDNLLVQSGTLLDIGAFTGYFCHRFEEIGFDCTAVEYHPLNVYFMARLKEALEKRFRIENRSILEWTDISEYDVVLALNIFHHFLKTEASHTQLIELLRRLRTRVMFFEPHLQSDYVMSNAFKNYSNEEFVSFILKHSCLSEARKIGVVGRGRPLYVLWA
ncbi:hypothetical protein [Rhodocaloribacter sp.]